MVRGSNPGGARSYAPVQTGPGAHPASGTGSFSGVKWPGRGVDHPPASSADVGGRVDLYIFSPRAFVACSAVKFTFTFTEFHPNRSRNTRTHARPSEQCDCHQAEVSLTHLILRNSWTEFHEIPKNGLAADTRSQTDRQTDGRTDIRRDMHFRPLFFTPQRTPKNWSSTTASLSTLRKSCACLRIGLIAAGYGPATDWW
jgi:hypothetical protein